MIHGSLQFARRWRRSSSLSVYLKSTSTHPPPCCANAGIYYSHRKQRMLHISRRSFRSVLGNHADQAFELPLILPNSACLQRRCYELSVLIFQPVAVAINWNQIQCHLLQKKMEIRTSLSQLWTCGSGQMLNDKVVWFLQRFWKSFAFWESGIMPTLM